MKIKIVTIVALALYLCGCKKEKQPEYGCDSPVLSTVNNISGVLYYDETSKQVSIVPEGFPLKVYQVCNPEYEQFEQLNYKTKDSIPVLFDGQLKALKMDYYSDPVYIQQQAITILSISKK
ncbi:hypothetical protein QNI19_38470 [Cytophagaceae bacterium DM2B3-1]|uniref:PEGA domain-containing protein n=1 Tax=Xanthocytophaga flava TaxID=3048013 RepID=A0ABT7CZF8_9BACT|nr:hypothetical protein [Xanthocytophaga flavus]MDJ1498876.1 hypothetical protein [Xanthocytophaga flavus]